MRVGHGDSSLNETERVSGLVVMGHDGLEHREQ